MRKQALLIPLLLLVAGCGPWGDRDGGDGDSHVVTAARHDRDEASLAVVSGATTVTVRAADLHDDLYRVSTPGDSRIRPEVVDDDGRLQLHLNGTGEGGAAAVEVLLNRDVRWDLRFSGGATETLVDMSGGQLAGAEFTAGSSRIEAVLPRPAGTVRLRMSGGAGEFLVRAPEAVPVRVAANGGAGAVVLDGDRHSGISGGTVFAPDGWDGAKDRYDVDAAAGVSTLTLSRT